VIPSLRRSVFAVTNLARFRTFVPSQFYEQNATSYFYSVLKACDGFVEAARRAGMSPAAAAAAVSVRAAMVRTVRLMPFDSYS